MIAQAMIENLHSVGMWVLGALCDRVGAAMGSSCRDANIGTLAQIPQGFDEVLSDSDRTSLGVLVNGPNIAN